MSVLVKNLYIISQALIFPLANVVREFYLLRDTKFNWHGLTEEKLEDEALRPRGTTTWEDNSSDVDYDDDIGEADDEFCVPTTPPERRGSY